MPLVIRASCVSPEKVRMPFVSGCCVGMALRLCAFVPVSVAVFIGMARTLRVVLIYRELDRAELW